MSRNLLPRLRQIPTPANVPEGAVGAWSAIQSPEELAKIEYQDPTGQAVRTRIQSIPSPWARMLLFRAALEDPGHPARDLVENEILDTLEFMWSLSRLPGIALTFRRVDVPRLAELGSRTGSRRAQDVADALVDLVPRDGSRSGQADIMSLVLGLVEGRPVFASSPYTIVFTGEDAARYAGVERFFDFAHGGPRRRLADRPVAFQEYIAQVVAPQLYTPSHSAELEYGRIQSLVRPWLEDEIRRCVAAARTEEVRRRVSLPVNRAEWDWREVAGRLGLEPVNSEMFAGMFFFRQPQGAELAHSPYLLRSTRPVEQAPLVLTEGRFQGVYYDGAPKIDLPPEFRALPRTRLPGLGVEYPWVSPADDWLTDRIVLLSEPIQREHVYGYAKYRWRGTTPDPRFAEPHMLLPLRSEFFRFFAPADVEHMLAIDAHPDGRVEVQLSIPIGTGETHHVVVRRVYTDADIVNEHGPAFSLWPSFQDQDWPDYVLFRHDTTISVAKGFAVDAYTGGSRLAARGQEDRTPLVETAVFPQPPEVLEVRSVVQVPGSRAESVGVLLPRYREAAPRGHDTWNVGVDFGTSNTVVSVRSAQNAHPQIFRTSDLVLPLTAASERTAYLMDAYFFPEELPPEPFGTAVVYHESLRSFELEQEPLGLRVNVPYAGDVDGYKSNRVQGDLKWSADRHAHFLSAAFLRHILATVLAAAIQQGVDPARVRFHWAYPRAFSRSQLNQLRQHWSRVLRSFAGVGVSEETEELDESLSVLRHFFNANLVQPAGDVKAIVDIGGGTSDIALYGHGRVLALDSVVLGGRNLTGARLQGGAGQDEGNPFVEVFFAWARDHGLPDPNRNAVQTYLDRGQVHLAFSYLVGTPWFREHRANLFTGHSAFHSFQALVLYFFGALFYYLGLSLQSLAPADGQVELPVSVLVAGNGSRYLDWLTDLVPERSGDDVFKRTLGHILAAGAGIQSPARVPSIVTSSQPKQEVARGLVAQVGPGDLPDSTALTTPVIGEAVTLRLGESGEMRTFSPAERFDSRDVIETTHVHDLRWGTDAREIERFHDALVRCSEMVASYGEQWTRVPQRYREFFVRFGRSEIQNRTEGRLQFLAQLEKGFRGSLFLLEAAVVLEEMRDRFFTS